MFPSDYAGWKATAGAALELEGSHPRKVTATFPLVRGVDTRTGGPTLALHKRVQGMAQSQAEAQRSPTPQPQLPPQIASRLPPHLPSWSVGHDPGSDGGEPGS